MAFRRRRFRRGRRPFRKRRRFGRKRFGRGARSYTSKFRGVGPFPRAVLTTHKFDLIEVQPNIAGRQQYEINLNGMFQPIDGRTTHQPYGFDQFAALYNRYKVYKCYYRIECYSGSGDPCYVAVVPTNQHGVLASMTDACEAPGAICKGFTAPQKAVFKGKVNLMKLTGTTRMQYADDDYGALNTGNPIEYAKLQVYLSDDAGAVIPSELCKFKVSLLFKAKWFDANVFASS